MADYNLILMHVPGLQDRSDFDTIGRLIRQHDPSINTHVCTISLGEEKLRRVESNPHGIVEVRINADPRAEPWSSLAALPTLLFSPIPMLVPDGIRGHRLFARHRSKLQEMDLLVKHGFPVPTFAVLHRGLILDEQEWGPLLILKPESGRGGKAVRLMRTSEVLRLAAAMPDAASPQHGRTIVQRWIDTGPCISSYRAMSVLGSVLYITKSTAVTPAQITPDDVDTDGLSVAANAHQRRFDDALEDDVLDLARRISNRIDFTNTLGIDIIREKATARLWVLEINSGFPTWHLSSRAAMKHEASTGTFKLADRYRQLNALESAADTLLKATRRLAS